MRQIILFGLLTICSIAISILIGLVLNSSFTALDVYFVLTILAIPFSSKFKLEVKQYE